MNDEKSTDRIRRSGEIGELAKALCKARENIPAIEKKEEGQKGKQKYKYADLSTIYHKAIPHLCNAGITHMQFPSYEEGRFVVTTLLMHGESGQWIESDCAFIYNSDNEYAADPKEQGLTITYIRRYAFIAAVGIIPGGDDDESKLGQNANGNSRRPFQSDKVKGDDQNNNGSDGTSIKAKAVQAIMDWSDLPNEERTAAVTAVLRATPELNWDGKSTLTDVQWTRVFKFVCEQRPGASFDEVTYAARQEATAEQEAAQ